MLTRQSFAAVPLGALAFVLACGGDSSGPPAVASVDVTGPSTNLIVGQTAPLSATPRDAKGNALTGRTVTWSSTSASVASVGSTGLVTAVAPGSATITATVDGKNGSIGVTVVPPPVAVVVVTGTLTTIQAGTTTQLAATTLDDNGNVLSGREIAWSTSNAAAATVSQAGLVTGVAEGTASITATSEGKSGSLQITVTPQPPANAPQISAVTPNPIVEGQSATITGTNFGTTAGGNVVRVGGVAATVTSASATSLQIVVPALNCRPAQNVNVDVSVGGVLGAPKATPFRPGTEFTLAAGQHRLLTNASEFCLQFPATAANESYLIGVQSVSENVTSVTPATVTAEAPAGAAVTASPTRVATAPTFAATLTDFALTPQAARLAKHRMLAARNLDDDRAMLMSKLGAVRTARSAQRSGAAASLAPTVPGTVKVGDVLNIKMPDRTKTSTCSNSVDITATVKSMGTRSIILEDTGNPAGGFTESDYQTLSNEFDTQIYATDAGYLGDPTDFDENSRVVIVVTKEVNKIDNLLGQVFSADLVPQSICSSSNEGEFFYGKAPDPNGVVNGKYATDTALFDARIIIAHEFAHVIQLGRRLANPSAQTFQATWELEGQATFAEEANGFAVLGLAPGQNYGFSVAFNTPAATPVNWFAGTWFDLPLYYGFESRTSRIVGAPEQCSWLATQSSGNTGPCLSGREVYGVPSSFLRWLSDQFGSSFAGGEKELHRRFIDNVLLAGYANIASVIGQPIDLLLSQWAAALYVDDRVAGADPKLAFKSWNLTDIESHLVQTARLSPYARAFGAFSDQVSVRGGSTAYFLVSGAGRPATGIRVRDAADGLLPGVMRVWVVRMQ